MINVYLLLLLCAVLLGLAVYSGWKLQNPLLTAAWLIAFVAVLFVLISANAPDNSELEKRVAALETRIQKAESDILALNSSYRNLYNRESRPAKKVEKKRTRRISRKGLPHLKQKPKELY